MSGSSRGNWDKFGDGNFLTLLFCHLRVGAALLPVVVVVGGCQRWLLPVSVVVRYCLLASSCCTK